MTEVDHWIEAVFTGLISFGFAAGFAFLVNYAGKTVPATNPLLMLSYATAVIVIIITVPYGAAWFLYAFHLKITQSKEVTDPDA